MKKTLLIMISPVALLALLLLFMPQHFASSNSNYTDASEARPAVAHNYPAASARKAADKPTVTANLRENASADETQELVNYALTLMGTPYVWAGETPEGFDCSGFITHVYDRYDVALPHSSCMQAEEGEQVTRQEAGPGDLVIFTGTNPQVREPGHVGIVISQPGDTIEFVHSSSNGGVKLSQVEGSGYEVRFLQVRRVL
ncbi:C40 family peptidase [Pontibacter kalidii]|uniref:C40 family peptidase n=1 Tax=Pontibacter kalidii TaxID=2592049 RepID=UPI00225025A9|nr:C40 family peptidase [Pontibacter kalidii]